MMTTTAAMGIIDDEDSDDDDDDDTTSRDFLFLSVKPSVRLLCFCFQTHIGCLYVMTSRQIFFSARPSHLLNKLIMQKAFRLFIIAERENPAQSDGNSKRFSR